MQIFPKWIYSQKFVVFLHLRYKKDLVAQLDRATAF